MDHDDPDQLSSVFVTRSRRVCRELTLVLTAADIENHIVRHHGSFEVLVPSHNAERAVTEVRAYLAEREDAPVATLAPPVHPRAGIGVLLYLIVLLVVAALEWRDAFGVDWRVAGQADALLIRHGQWWRAATALTLHASPAHLLGNAVLGGIVGYFAAQMVGSGLAWSCILVGGIAGNLINAWVRPHEHYSIGASTAVFAALGLMAAVAQKGRIHGDSPKLLRFAPLIGATVLLAFLGTGSGSGRTDVGAHIFGFLSGLVVGVVFAWGQDALKLQSRLQLALGLMTGALLVTAWAVALAHGTG